MSVVWRAFDEVLGRDVAVKALAGRYAADHAARRRIRAEAQAVARLSHPHVANVYDYGEASDADGHPLPYVVMELLTGRTLAERLAKGALPWRTALRIGAEVASALAAAHARGLVHQDIKPANVMLTADGAKVVDFGIAAVAGELAAGPGGVLLGTPAYLAPERLSGGPAVPATDVYALCLLIYRMLTRSRPWPAETTTDLLAAHAYLEPQPLPPIAGLPPAVAELTRRGLAKDPEDRPTSREVARTLAAAAGIQVPLGGLRPIDMDDTGADERATTEAIAESAVVLPARSEQVRPGRLRDAWVALATPARSGEATGPATDSPGAAGRGRLVQIGAGLAGLGLAAVVLATCASPGPERSNQAAAGRAGVGVSRAPADGAPCYVRYQVRRDVPGSFQVALTVQNTSTVAVNGWSLGFSFEGDQIITGGSGAQFSQAGAAVTVRNDAANVYLPPSGAATAVFEATYGQDNRMPTRFALDGAECAYALIGATGTTTSGGPPLRNPGGAAGASGLPGGGAGVPTGPQPGGGTAGVPTDTGVVTTAPATPPDTSQPTTPPQTNAPSETPTPGTSTTQSTSESTSSLTVTVPAPS